MEKQQAEKILKQKFGINSFHERQWEVITGLLNGERILLIERTGFGKSLCYQFPAVMFEGLTIVFSPLIALMRDQVTKLTNLGIAAGCINSNQSPQQNEDVINAAINSKLKLLYIAPERLLTSKWQEIFSSLNISLVVIDEAHCISTWGHDFRPAYKKIINLISPLPTGVPALAATATATEFVAKDIAQQVSSDMKISRGSLMRSNLKPVTIKVKSEDEKLIRLLRYMTASDGNGIVYTGTRLNTEIYSKWLRFNKISAVNYNAGLEAKDRRDIEMGFLSNKWKAVVATNALGMGIDKPDIRFVIHTQFPPSPLDYYQEIGRAGRDGNNSDVILYYSDRDRSIPEYFFYGKVADRKIYVDVINFIKKKSPVLSAIEKKFRIEYHFLNVMLEDLSKAGIIDVDNTTGKYFYVSDNDEMLNEIIEYNKSRKQNFDAMLKYIELQSGQFEYLCRFLGDSVNIESEDQQTNSNDDFSINEDEKMLLRNFRDLYFEID